MKIVIVGDGKVGLTLTQLLCGEGHDVTVVDSNSKVLQRMQEECDAMAVCGHGASRSVLAEAGADEADLLIAAASSDEVNLLSCLMARKMGCKATIARVRSPEYAGNIEILRKELGLTFVTNPEEACAREIYRILQYPSFLAREQFAQGRVEIVRFKLTEGSALIGVPLNRLYQTAKVRVLVCAVYRGGQVIIPDGSVVLQQNDDIFVTAASVDLAALIKNLGLAKRKITQVGIVGGGLLAFYLAGMLIKSGVSVKIIERDEGRCQKLSELLPEADIVQGDGTEQDVLLEEGIERGDALVSLTGIDEENIVLSMYARQLGVQTTITKCNRGQYTNMFRQIDIDSVVSPKTNCAEEIVRYVRAMASSTGGQMVTMHNIAGDAAEALEFIADGNSKTLGIPLVDLQLKKGILIACISRGRATIIPRGDSTIETGDSVVVVATKGHEIFDLDNILL